MTIRQLDEKVFIAGQLRPEEIAGLAERGLTLIVNNRPDGEEPGQPLGTEIEEAASAAGIEYRSVPIIRGIGPADADAMNEAIASTDGKVLAFCRTGTRSGLTWAVAQSNEGVAREEIEQKLIGAGVDPTPIAHLL
ncbi:TIGR01244 family sulfur transferase [Sphingomonas sp. SM33]|uniref:TIGR01244 family sulfur transferase n=1 Tax=Sphingomonas telluris TaxID=2907998 RepID=A0ABS9VQU6_9SPHN|nr:TIGR01244 family sulfur transferase [Sphingomonas telluris]MCH8616894.1 TIGR01244 family sulfur transferase [Sphingomonas telluris]